MIINSSYFEGDIFLPQTGSDASTVANNNSKLQRVIEEREREILEKAFGYKMYNDLYNQLQSNGTLKTDADPIWGDLMNGVEYTKNDVKHHWRGIVKSLAGHKYSFVAYYIYYWYVSEGVEQITVQGTVKSSAKNAESASPTNKLVSSWRKFHEWYGGCDNQGAYFKGYVKGLWYEDYFLGANNTKEVSLYQFLTDHSDVYPDWSFSPIENKNSWGL